MRLRVQGAAILVASLALLLYSLSIGDLVLYAISLSALITLYHDRARLRRLLDACTPIEARRTIIPDIVGEASTAIVHVNITPKNSECSLAHEIIVEEDVPPTLSNGKQNTILRLRPAEGDKGGLLAATYILEAKTPGRHCYGKLRIHISSPLGLFIEEVELSIHTCITVLPAILDDRFAEEAVTIATAAAGKRAEGLYNLAWIRDYQHGDDARKILWKHFARTGRLLVRVDQATAHPKTIVALANLASTPSDGVCDAAASLRLAASIATRLSRSGAIVHLIACIDGAPSTKKAFTEKEKTIAWLAYASDYGSSCQLDAYTKMLRKEVHMRRPDAVYIVASLPTILALTPKGYQRFLEEIVRYRPKPRLIITSCHETIAEPRYSQIAARILEKARKNGVKATIATFARH